MTEETPKLLPCPFCGDANARFAKDYMLTWGHIICKDCFAQGPSIQIPFPGEKPTWEEQAWERWNKRA